MTENNAPPPEKRSFIPTEEEMKRKQQSETQTPVKEIPSAEVSLHLINGKLEVVIEELKAFNSLFQKASQIVKAQRPDVPAITQPLPPTSVSTPVPDVSISPRVKEILTALEPVKDLLKIDTESSTMMIIVRPAQFLGSDNFAKVASIVRNLGGQYVSAGKNSHFEVSKAPTKV